MSGADTKTTIDAMRTYLPVRSWVGRCVERAFDELDRAGNPFAAVPGWNDRVANASYSYGNIASPR